MPIFTIFILVILALILLETGIIYALQILHTPVSPGYTYLSVATGFNFILLGALAGWLAMSYFGMFNLATTIIVALISGGLMGGPMFYFQWSKRQEAESKKDKVKKEGKFADE